jgi:sugar phosphate isomerase/epimerase
MISLGIDTSCWQERLFVGEVTIEDVIDDCVVIGCDFVHLGLRWLDSWEVGRVREFAEHAKAGGVGLEVMGGPISIGFCDGDVAAGAARVEGWLRTAAELASQTLMVFSGCFRHEMVRHDGRIEAEMSHITAVLKRSAELAEQLGVQLLFENAGDFKAVEVERIVTSVDREGVGVFLDLTNPHLVFDEPNDAIRRLAPLASAGHVKDFTIDSVWPGSAVTRSHASGARRGFQLLYCYPGEGVSDLSGAMRILAESCQGRTFLLAIEGLDSRIGLADQIPRVTGSLAALQRLVPAEA